VVVQIDAALVQRSRAPLHHTRGAALLQQVQEGARQAAEARLAELKAEGVDASQLGQALRRLEARHAQQCTADSDD
jgi:hypothetical protein